MKEAEDHNDIIVEDFHDTYLNLTIKTTYLLKWLGGASNCSRAKFVLKVGNVAFHLNTYLSIYLLVSQSIAIRCLQVDDDVFVNPDQLWRTLESSHLYSVMVNMPATSSPVNIDYALIGHVMNTVPIRDPASKWYLPPTFYPLNIFPSFLSGTGYLLTGSLVPALYSCALSTPFINLEDVFLTGLCATTQLRSHPNAELNFESLPLVTY